MIKPLALAISVVGTLLSTQTQAYDYGQHANTTLEKLINDYPGRYRGTANFAGAADWMQSQMGSAYNLSRQNFTWNNGTRASQNVVAYAAGTKPQYVVIGAHFDTYFGRPTLQGLDDNGSGASVLTEVARNLGGLPLENGLQVVGFGAEDFLQGFVIRAIQRDLFDAQPFGGAGFPLSHQEQFRAGELALLREFVAKLVVVFLIGEKAEVIGIQFFRGAFDEDGLETVFLVHIFQELLDLDLRLVIRVGVLYMKDELRVRGPLSLIKGVDCPEFRGDINA